MPERNVDSARRLERGQNERPPHRRDDIAGWERAGGPLSCPAMRDDRNAAATTGESDDAVVADLVRERDGLRREAAALPALEREAQALREELAAIGRSPSWRVPAPLRGARALVANRRALVLAAGRRVKRHLER